MKYKDRFNKVYIGLLNFEGDVFRAYDEGSDLFTIVDENLEIVSVCNAFGILQVMEGKVHLKSAQGRVYDVSKEHPNAKPTKKELYDFLHLQLPARETAIEFAKWVRREVQYEPVVKTFFYKGAAYVDLDELYDVFEAL